MKGLVDHEKWKPLYATCMLSGLVGQELSIRHAMKLRKYREEIGPTKLPIVTNTPSMKA